MIKVWLKLFLFTMLFNVMLAKADERIVVGRFGVVYPIKEKDAYEEILERVKRSGLEQKFLGLKGQISKHLKVNFSLEKARENNVRVLNLTYTLPYDIKDHLGKVIYPKGYSFNPLDYMVLPFYFIFVDGTSEKELNWLKESGHLYRYDNLIIITKGNVWDVSNFISREVYAASKKILEYFKIKKVPSIVYQDKNYLVVQEIGVYKK